jgi:hypothetical protein
LFDNNRAASAALAAGTKAGHRHGLIGASGGDVDALSDQHCLSKLSAVL